MLKQATDLGSEVIEVELEIIKANVRKNTRHLKANSLLAAPSVSHLISPFI